ncbi:MAG: SpoIVB peptidase [Oscillospiraceae bacterium]|nr:SpoIVB peptidase [Oscillospiraceae bacterium]
MKKIIYGIYISFISLTVLLFLQIAFYYTVVPDNFLREEKTGFDLKAYPSVSVKNQVTEAITVSSRSSGEQKMTVMLYGVIPIKDVTVTQVSSPMLIPSGEAFGLKMLTDGVYVTEYGNVDGAVSVRSPAREGGILVGDVIICANGQKVMSSSQLSEAVQLSPDRTVLTVVRDGRELTVILTPEKSRNDGMYKLGVWTRDSCAGIGTLTYYDRENMTYGGLGHSVCDADTGQILPLSTGETVPVCINSVIRGINGAPGELCGTFMSASATGSIELNTDCGVFGYTNRIPGAESVPMAFKQEIEIGEATILTTVDGMTPQSYGIVIEKVNYNSDSAVKNMVIRITDQKLLSKTGGIVQGMSGSPIIQNGKLIGAVTHVFVNDVSRGYAIFAENMYANSINLTQYDNFQNVS